MRGRQRLSTMATATTPSAMLPAVTCQVHVNWVSSQEASATTPQPAMRATPGSVQLRSLRKRSTRPGRQANDNNSRTGNSATVEKICGAIRAEKMPPRTPPNDIHR